MQIKRLGLSRFFKRVDVVSPKDVINQKAKALVSGQYDYFIGDTEADFRSSLYAETEFFGVCTGLRSKDYLLKEGVQNIKPNFFSVIKDI